MRSAAFQVIQPRPQGALEGRGELSYYEVKSAMDITIPARTITLVIPAYTITVPDPTVVPTPSVHWLYHAGVKTLAGDFTQAGTAVDYFDISGAPADGPTDILFTSSAAYGLFLPYFAPNYALPNPGWKNFLISVKTTIPGENWKIYFEKVGDLPTGVEVMLAPKYGPAHVPGQWGSYVVPLADLGVAGDAALYKCGLQSSFAGNTRVYFNDLGLQ